MSYYKTIKGVTCDVIKQDAGITFTHAVAQDGKPVVQVHLGPERKATWAKRLKAYKQANENVLAYAKAYSFPLENFHEVYKKADAKGKRALTKQFKHYENSVQYRNRLEASVAFHSLKTEITQDFYNAVTRHHIDVLNHFLSKLGVSKQLLDDGVEGLIKEFEEHEYFTVKREYTLDSGVFAEASKISSEDCKGNLRVSVEFDSTVRHFVKRIAIVNDDKLFYEAEIVSDSWTSKETADSTTASLKSWFNEHDFNENKFDNQLFCAIAPLASDFHDKVVSLALSQCYCRKGHLVFMTLNADGSDMDSEPDIGE